MFFITKLLLLLEIWFLKPYSATRKPTRSRSYPGHCSCILILRWCLFCSRWFALVLDRSFRFLIFNEEWWPGVLLHPRRSMFWSLSYLSCFFFPLSCMCLWMCFEWWLVAFVFPHGEEGYRVSKQNLELNRAREFFGHIAWIWNTNGRWRKGKGKWIKKLPIKNEQSCLNAHLHPCKLWAGASNTDRGGDWFGVINKNDKAMVCSSISIRESRQMGLGQNSYKVGSDTCKMWRFLSFNSITNKFDKIDMFLFNIYSIF